MSTMSEGPMAPPRSWWSRNWAWFIPMGCLGLLLSCGCLGALIAGFTLKSLRDTGAFAEAITRVRQSPEAREWLGEPIEADWKFQGSMNTVNGEGSAHLAIPVHGPKGEGTLQVEAYKHGAEPWSFTTLILEVPDHPDMDLLGGHPVAPSDAPSDAPHGRPDLPEVEPLPDDGPEEPAEPEEPPAHEEPRKDKDIQL